MRALHFGKHCPRMKANKTRRWRYSHARRNNLIQENRLAYNLAFIESFESERRRAGGGEAGQRQRQERDGRARACTMENQKFEPMHREAHLRQRDAARSCPADSFTTPEKEMIKEGGSWGEKEEDNQWYRSFALFSTATNRIKLIN